MNKTISKIHFDILDNARREVLDTLIPLTRDFVLGGGTALALQLAHRESYDFDFFTRSEIKQNLRETVAKKIDIEHTVVDMTSELTFFTTKEVKITFLSYPFIPYHSVITLENGLSLFPVEEIALQKAYTIGRRGEYRDYFDLYTILSNNLVQLEELMTQAKSVYGGAFDEKLFLQQLVYFDDMTTFTIAPIPGKPIASVEEIKEYFIDVVKQLL